MRYGFTTGSCAAAASKAATYMLLTGKIKEEIQITTPKGIVYNAKIEDIQKGEGYVSCAVRKDGGDDPDITTGMLVYSRVTLLKDGAAGANGDDAGKAMGVNGDELGKAMGATGGVAGAERIIIDGGDGVGRVTKPGLDRPVGDAAINTVPREMIKAAVNDICDLYDYDGELQIVISVPGGEELAQKTFNPKLGIEGGISIIGTSGIVEPMSTQAIKDTIKIELRQRYESGFDYVAISPGNYGLDYMKNTYGYDLDKSVKCSNFIGDTMDMANELGFKEVLYVGHVGKLIKVAGGIMNTHSKEGDSRMEILSYLAIQRSDDIDSIREMSHSVTTEEAAKILKKMGICDEVMKDANDRICRNLERRAGDEIKVQCIMFSKELGELSVSDGARELVERLVKEG
ncbi:MAG: cobalt-precorrin-5B (C(1))-methyltransferase CbiD [Lachnospiraceae bacterium]|nr:cobalt-precorrin-5B (C(1))-methyltransferase CbiD [Lachnospiraceae bacterium]